METEKKQLFKGQFNWKGEIHVMWRWAHNPVHAEHLFINHLADTLMRSPYALRQYFNDGKDRYSIVLDPTTKPQGGNRGIIS